MRLAGIVIAIAMLALPAASARAEDPIVGTAGKNAPRESIFSYIHPAQKQGDDKVWFLTLGGMYERKLGNTDTLRSNFTGELKFDDEISSVILTFQGFYGTAHDVKTEDRGSAVVRVDHYILPRIEMFAYSWSEYNLMADLMHRNNTGAGMKLVFFRNYFWKMDLSGAPVYQYEKYRIREDTRDWRWSVRYRVLATPVNHTVLSFICFYIPKIVDAADHRVVLDTKLTITITPELALGAGYIRNYNSNPYPGTKGLDTNLYSQVALKI
jgi:hypothetical protein